LPALRDEAHDLSEGRSHLGWHPHMAGAVDNSERLNCDFGNDTCPRQVCGGQNPHFRAIHPRTAEASMQYTNQIILQLEQDPPGNNTIRDMSRGLLNKHPNQSTHFLFDVKGDNPTLVYKDGVTGPQFYQNMRIYLVGHGSDTGFTVSGKNPKQLADLLAPFLPVQVKKIVLVACNSTLPPGVEPGSDVFDFAKGLYTFLGGKRVMAVSGYSAWMQVQNNRKEIALQRYPIVWQPANANRHLKRTYLYPEMVATPASVAGTAADDDAMDID
jgi:hypothetical protein